MSSSCQCLGKYLKKVKRCNTFVRFIYNTHTHIQLTVEILFLDGRSSIGFFGRLDGVKFFLLRCLNPPRSSVRSKLLDSLCFNASNYCHQYSYITESLFPICLWLNILQNRRIKRRNESEFESEKIRQEYTFRMQSEKYLSSPPN